MGYIFLLNDKISRVSLLVVLVYFQLGSFFLSTWASQNVDFYLQCYLAVTRCLLQIQPLYLRGRQKEAVKNKTFLIYPLLQRKLSMVLSFSTKFCSDLIG